MVKITFSLFFYLPSFNWKTEERNTTFEKIFSNIILPEEILYQFFYRNNLQEFYIITTSDSKLFVRYIQKIFQNQ